jgi:hypothetical protein
MSTRINKIVRIFLSLVLLSTYFAFYPINSEAAIATQASIQISDPRPSQASVTYTVTFVHGSTSTIKCIVVQFSSSADMSGSAPTSMLTTSAVKGSLSGTGITNGNWSLYDGFNNSNTNGYLQFENATGDSITAGNYATASATTITNTSSSTFYARITTYSGVATHTCSTQVDQSNILALTTTGGVATTVTVDPTISFSVAGYSSAVNGGPAPDLITTPSSIAFGNVSAGGSATSAAQLLTTSTNAANGYSLYIRSTQALTDSNNDTIRDQSGTPASPASFDGTTSQSSFAYTTDSSTVAFGSNKWAGLTTTNTNIDTKLSPQNATTLHVEYQLQLKNTQPPGTYSNVITYTATPSY